MTYDDQDNSWLDAMVSEVPVAPVNTVKPKTASKGLWKMPAEFCAKVSERRRGQTGVTGFYERSPEVRARNRQASSIPVMTPDGMFASKGEAAEFYGIHRNNFSIRMKQFPDQYYALVERNSRGNSTQGSQRKGLWKMTPEVCAKISASLKGKAQSAEHTAKISAGKKGRTAWNKGKTMMSAEARAKISAAQKGKQVSKETRAKLSAAQKGKPKTRKNQNESKLQRTVQH